MVRIKKLKIKSSIEISEELIILKGDFTVEIADFDIKIPIVVRNNIAKRVKVSFELNHKPYE